MSFELIVDFLKQPKTLGTRWILEWYTSTAFHISLDFTLGCTSFVAVSEKNVNSIKNLSDHKLSDLH